MQVQLERWKWHSRQEREAGGWWDGVVISLSLSYLSTLPPNAILMRIPPGPLLTAHQSETTADLLKFCVLSRGLCLNTYFDLSGYWLEIFDKTDCVDMYKSDHKHVVLWNQGNGKKTTTMLSRMLFFIFMYCLWSLASKSNSIEYLPTVKMCK